MNNKIKKAVMASAVGLGLALPQGLSAGVSFDAELKELSFCKRGGKGFQMADEAGVLNLKGGVCFSFDNLKAEVAGKTVSFKKFKMNK